MSTVIRHPKQSGSILLWGLIILLVMTMLGVVGARMASTDVKIAGNAIYQVLAYQGAESTLERSADLFFQNEAAKSITGSTKLGPFNDSAQGGNVVSNSNVIMSNKIPCNSLEQLGMSIAMNSDEYQCRLFDVEVDARVPGTSARSTHSVGVIRLVPSSPQK